MAEPAGWRFTGEFVPGGAPPPPAPPASGEEAGPELSGTLELLGTLGRGGFAVVHRARDRASGREVALKVLRGDRLGNPLSRSRFQREGALAARLQHEGIVRVHAAGTFGGEPCLVLELVEGPSLAQALPGLPLERRLELVRDAARALGHAHAQGVLHRDVKPENILVDAAGRARVADFGLAGAEDLERLTRSGVILGTPYYMSPEQLFGGVELGPTTDVWALGVVLYQAATGELPFRAGCLAELAGELQAGRLQGPRALRPELSPDLEAVCLRALRADPAERYPDGEALARDLDALLRGEAPPGAGRGPRRWLRRARRPLLLAAAAVVALSGVGFQVLMGRPRPPAADPVALPEPARRPVRADPLAELEPLLRAPAPRARARGLTAWLAAHGDHRRAGEARQALEAARGRAPLLTLRRGGTGGLFFGPEDLVVWEFGLLRRVDGDGRERGRWSLGEVGPRAGRLLPDGGLLLGGNRLLRLGPLGAEPPRVALDLPCGAGLRALAVAPGRGLIAVAQEDEVRLLALAEGAERQRLSFEGRPVNALAFSPDEALLVVACGEGAPPPLLQAWRLEPGGTCSLAWRHHGPLEGGSALAFSPRGDLLAVGTRAQQLLLFDPRGGTELDALCRESEPGDGPLQRMARVAHTVPVRGLAFSPDGVRLHSLGCASQTPPTELRAWDPAIRRPLGKPLVFPEGVARGLDLDPAGERLLVAFDDATLQVWAVPE